MSGMAVTGDSPEKQRGGMIGHCHGAADQAWSSAAVAAAVVFQTDRRRAAPYRPPPHACLPGTTRGARGPIGRSSRLVRFRHFATVLGLIPYRSLSNRIGSMGRREIGAAGSIAYPARHAVARRAKAGRWADDAVARVVELVREDSLQATGRYTDVKNAIG